MTSRPAERPSQPEVTGRYDCPACPDRFESIGDKKRHIRDKHSKENR